MFKKTSQRLSNSVLVSTLFETLPLLETATLLGVFSLRTRSAVAGFGPTGCGLFSRLTLASLHFTPLPANELQEFFFGTGPNGLFGTSCGDPKPPFPAVRTAWVRCVFFPLYFAKSDRSCRHEQTFQVRLEHRGVFGYPPA